MGRGEAAGVDLTRAAAEVITAAERSARERVQAILVERLTRELLAEADRQLRQRDEPPDACCVHAITWADAARLAGVIGLDGRGDVTCVSAAELAAVISPVEPSLFAGLEEESVTDAGRLARLAERHDDIVFAVARQATVLPLRFGTTVRDTAAAEELLRQHHAVLRGSLERLAGRWEWICKLRADSQRSSRADRGEQDDFGTAARGAGTRYITERNRQLQERRAADAQVRNATETVSRLCGEFAEATATVLDAEAMLSVALLVPHESAEGLQRALDSLTAELGPFGLTVELRGPLPPYHFVHDAVGALV